MNEVAILLNEASDRQLNFAVHQLSRYLFLDINFTYNPELFHFVHRLTLQAVKEQMQQKVEFFQEQWDQNRVPQHVKEEYFNAIVKGLHHILNKQKDVDLFFNEYYKHKKLYFSAFNKYSNRLDTEFDELMQFICQLQFDSSFRRSRILAQLIHALTVKL